MKPTTWGTSIEIGSPSMAASASIPPTPGPRTPSPFTIGVWESVPTRVSGRAKRRPSISPGVDHAREVLEVHLVDDAGVRGDHLDVAEGVLAPAQEGVTLGVALVLELGVPDHGQGAPECVDLDGVVDGQLGGQGGVDARGIAAEVVHRVAHRGEVHEGPDASEVLEEDPARAEGDLVRRVAGPDPTG